MPIAMVAQECDLRTIDFSEWTEQRNHPHSWVDLRDEVLSNQQAVEELAAEISQARRILELEENWDGEGSTGYSEDTLNRAFAFLSTHVEGLWGKYGLSSPIPRIAPGPNGSIDLHWKQPSWELLVNIPEDANQVATFYGDDYGVQKIRGSLHQSGFHWKIAAWLTH